MHTHQHAFFSSLWETFCLWHDCSRTLGAPNRMQQVGILLTGTLDKVNKHIPVHFTCWFNLLWANGIRRSDSGNLMGNEMIPYPVCVRSWATTFQRSPWAWGTARSVLRWRSPTHPEPLSSSSPGSFKTTCAFVRKPRGNLVKSTVKEQSDMLAHTPEGWQFKCW